jgi:hypothetical protein
MPAPAVHTAVKNRLETLWVPSHESILIDVNEQEDQPSDASAFVLITYPIVNPGSQMSIGSPGSNLFRETGVIAFDIHRPRGEGADTGRQWAWDLAAVFRAKEFDSMRTWDPSSPTEDDRSDIGAYWVFRVTVPYWFDFFG